MVGDKTGGPLCDDLKGDNRFTGKGALGDDHVDRRRGPPHQPEQRMRALMAIQ